MTVAEWDDTPEEPDWLVAERAEVRRHVLDDEPPWDPYDELDASLPALATYTAPKARPAANGHDGTEHTSWWPLDLSELFSGDHHPPSPTLCPRSDGQALLYAGKCHAFNGESESGKTWAALIACVQVIRDGGHVLYLDFEDTADTVVTRLLALGARPAQVLELFHYAQPHEPIFTKGMRFTPANADLGLVLDAYDVALAVIDGVTEAMTLHGLDLLGNADYATFHGALPRRLAAAGAAVVQIDHVTKDRENRGRWAIGAQHKLAAMDGAVFSFQVAQPFGLGRHGIAKMSIEKDRPGALRQHAVGKRIADLHLDSDADTHALAWSIETPDTPEGDDGTTRPTIVMERVSRFLEDNPQGMSKRSIRTAVAGSNDLIDLAIDFLLEGYITVEKDGSSHRHVSVKPYRVP